MAALLLILRFYPHAPLAARVPLSTAIYSADGELLRVTLSSDDQFRLWTPLSQMSPQLVDAFLLKEDRWFYLHPGVNLSALTRAAFRTARGERRQGGSTITMQLARLLYGQKTRTPAGKFRQILTALWLESRYSKHDILEAYLNLAPFGGNIQGVGAASRVYFGKSANRVTLGEAVSLAVMPQSPARRNHGRARARLAALWLAHHRTTDTDRRQLDTPISGGTYAMPYLAPHFVDSLLAARPARTPRIDTTLDSALQRTVERQISRYVDQFGDRGIHNASALLLDARDMSVRAWVGSANYWDVSIDGQVDGVLAKRSPGSALKPFIYAMALDQGILHPRTILRDSPTSFGPFTPENFDGRFMGPIPAEEALIRSRNIPAVAVSMQLKQPSLYGFLQSAGISRLQPEQHYGLALALGGGEVTMEELAGLYAMLANAGVLQPICSAGTPACRAGTLAGASPLAPVSAPTRVPPAASSPGASPLAPVSAPTRVPPAPSSPGASPLDPLGPRLVSPEAAFITLDMLRHNPRPDDDGAPPLRARWPVAWKTGTSWGFRDAWSAGIVGPYVLVVWIGDFTGKGNPAFIGVDAAAPLFFRIADAVNFARIHEPAPPLIPPPGVAKVAVCAESGDLPNVWCPHRIDTWYIPGKSPIRVSTLHRGVAIDIATGRPTCPPYSPETTRMEVYEFCSSDMRKLFREAGMPRRMPPVLPACAADDSGDSPRIASPLLGVTYTLRRSRPDTVIALDTHAAADVRTVFWFDGNALIGKSAIGAGALPWRPSADGAHLIRVIDDHGRAADRDIQVQYVE